MTPEQHAASDQLDADIADMWWREAVACVRREWAMRRKVYPGMVARGRMTPETAVKEERAMRGVLRLLVEMKCGHATPEYIALCESYGVYDHDGGRA